MTMRFLNSLSIMSVSLSVKSLSHLIQVISLIYIVLILRSVHLRLIRSLTQSLKRLFIMSYIQMQISMTGL